MISLAGFGFPRRLCGADDAGSCRAPEAAAQKQTAGEGEGQGPWADLITVDIHIKQDFIQFPVLLVS